RCFAPRDDRGLDYLFPVTCGGRFSARAPSSSILFCLAFSLTSSTSTCFSFAFEKIVEIHSIVPAPLGIFARRAEAPQNLAPRNFASERSELPKSAPASCAFEKSAPIAREKRKSASRRFAP